MKRNYLDPDLLRTTKVEDNLDLDYHQGLEKDISSILENMD